MKKKHNTGLVFRNTLLSYACVLLLPILLCSFYYVHSYSTLKERTRINQHLVVENLGEQINSTLTDAINLSTHLQLNKYVIALSNSKSTLNSSPTMDRYYLQKDLFTLQISNEMIQGLNIYFPESDYIVSTYSTHQSSLLPYMDDKSNTMSLRNLESVTKALTSSKIAFTADDNKSFIMLSTPLLADSSGKPLSILCIQIDKNLLLNRMQSQLFLDYPCVFAISDSNQLLLHTEDSSLSLAQLALPDIFTHYQNWSKAPLYETSHESTLVIDYYPLLISDTALLSIADKNNYQAQTRQLLTAILLTLAMCILIGITVITWISRKTYAPVAQIVHFIEDKQKNKAPARNEYQLILQMLTQNQNEIEKQHELLRYNYVQKIFSGEIEFQQVPGEVANQFAFNLPHPLVCMVLLSVEHPSQENASSSALDLTSFVIQNVYRELLDEVFPNYYFCPIEQKHAVLINIPENVESNQISPLEQISALTRKMITFLFDSFQLNLRAGISNIHLREQLPTAYLQACTASEYLQLFKSDNICLYEALPEDGAIGSIPLGTSEYIINMVISGNRAQLRDYFQDIRTKLGKYVLSRDDAKSCFYFFYQATAILQLYCQSHYGLQLDALRFLDSRFFSQSLPKALTQICDAYLSACSELEEKCQNPFFSHWGKDICQFIDNNYFNPNINLNSIAEHFRISPSYLSRKFKEQYQKSVIDYLYEIRITHATELLATTDLKVADVAQMTGFIDSNAFIRIFKKSKGSTPGKYKETLEGLN